VKVPEELKEEEAVGVGCAFRTAVAAYERLGVSVSGRCSHPGAGPVGLYSLLLAVEGGRKTIVVGAPRLRLELAKRWGADHVINIEEVPDPSERQNQILDLTHGRGPDVVVEGSGVPAAFSEGLEMIRKGGRYLIIGQTTKLATPVKPGLILDKGLDVIGSSSATIPHFYKALQFIKNKRARYPLADIVTNKYTLEQANDALKAMQAGKEIKPVIDNRGH
jgi:threonine dehydrogenase-like Zn-dependent dehydrogenase